MIKEEFDDLIDYVVKKCVELKNKYIDKSNLQIDYVCLFSHNKEEFSEFIKHAAKIGEIVNETKTGPVFKFHSPLKTIAGDAKVLKIRLPDKTRKEKGDVDFTTNYQEFKKKYIDHKNFSLIVREKFEMIELRDNKFDVLVYFSSIQPSKPLGIK